MVGGLLGSLARAAALCLGAGVRPAEASLVLVLRHSACCSSWADLLEGGSLGQLGQLPGRPLPGCGLQPLWLNNSSTLSGFNQDPANSQEVAVVRRQSRKEMSNKHPPPIQQCGGWGCRRQAARGWGLLRTVRKAEGVQLFAMSFQAVPSKWC